MSAIGPGDWVEWLGYPNGHAGNTHVASSLQRGCIYCVTEIGRFCQTADGTIWPSIRVSGVSTHDADGIPVSYPVAGFRPIYRPKSELIEQLLRKSTTPQTVDA